MSGVRSGHEWRRLYHHHAKDLLDGFREHIPLLCCEGGVLRSRIISGWNTFSVPKSTLDSAFEEPMSDNYRPGNAEALNHSSRGQSCGTRNPMTSSSLRCAAKNLRIGPMGTE